MKKFRGGRLVVRVNSSEKEGGEVLDYNMTGLSEEQMDVLGNAIADIDKHIDNKLFFAGITKGYIEDGNN